MSTMSRGHPIGEQKPGCSAEHSWTDIAEVGRGIVYMTYDQQTSEVGGKGGYKERADLASDAPMRSNRQVGEDA